jgi:Ca2+-binding EF-hand superfamily protein
LIRIHRDQELQQIEQAFKELNRGMLGTLVSKRQAIFALAKLDMDMDDKTIFLPEDSVPGTNPEGPCIDLRGFVRLALRHRNAARHAFKNNGGFSCEELVSLREAFNRYDKDSSGDISNRELIHLIEDAFPQMANDPKMRVHLLAMISEIDHDSSGSLDFSDFVRLMQQLRELRDKELVAKEQEAIRETGFTQQEVKEFREIFLTCDVSEVGEVSVSNVRNLIKNICPMGDQNSRQMTEMFRAVTSTQRADGPRDVADFPEFLQFMRKILDVNFAGIREKTGSMGSGQGKVND